MNGYLPTGLQRDNVLGGVEVHYRDEPRVFYVEVMRGRSGAWIGRYDEEKALRIGGGDDRDDPDDGDDDDEDEDEEKKRKNLDIILQGEAIKRRHAFPYESVSTMEVGSVVYGSVRKWDGLVHLYASPTHTSSGVWLYRGYYSSNRNWIGRSRDTWTTEFDQEGYEGVFTMTRRED